MRDFQESSRSSLVFFVICLQTSIIAAFLSKFKSECIFSPCFPRISRIFFRFAVQTLRVLNHGTLHMLTIWLVIYVLFSVPMLLLLSPSFHAIY